MSSYRLTHKAAEDLASIYTFSFERFGESKADAYLMALEERFILLAQNPALGQRIDFIRSGYRRFRHVSHTIFYTADEEGVITIVRVLHSSQDVDDAL